MNKKESVKMLDVDKVLKVLKEKYPEENVDREWLAKKINSSYQNLINYKMGKLPRILATFDKLMELTGMSFEELIIEKK